MAVFEVITHITYRIEADSEEEAHRLATENGSGCDVDGISVWSCECIEDDELMEEEEFDDASQT